MISKDSIHQVRQIHDIIPIYQSYVSLKKKGRNYIGLCPFHSEKSPSFVVSPEKRIFHCFGCHESGDHISFVMKIENCGFSDAIRQLAENAGIELIEDEKQATEEDKRRETLARFLELVSLEFESQLQQSPGADYLRTRGLTDASMAKFHLGFQTEGLDLRKLFESTGLPEDALRQTGLFYQNNQGHWSSRFRNRLIFPIRNTRSKTVGFSGRTMEKNSNVAKYVNSEDSLLFNKRYLVYGLDVAKQAIRKTQSILLMEGYMDVIMAHQFGFENAVATMGTAVTTQQAQQLKRFGANIYMCMDSDEAGQQAIERSHDILKEQGFTIYQVPLPDKDPADLLQHHGAAEFQSCLDKAQPIILFLLNRGIQQLSTDKIEDKVKLINQLIPLLKQEKEAMIQTHYIREISNKLRVDEKLIQDKLLQNPRNVITKKYQSTSQPMQGKYAKAEESLIYILATHADTRQHVVETLRERVFVDTTLEALYKTIVSSALTDHHLLESIDDMDQKKRLSKLLIAWQEKGEPQATQWQALVRTLNGEHDDQRIAEIKLTLQNRSLDHETEVKPLLEELNNLIRKSQGGMRNG